jgi:Zn ribbon nucleic-acid-binding protein
MGFWESKKPQAPPQAQQPTQRAPRAWWQDDQIEMPSPPAQEPELGQPQDAIYTPPKGLVQDKKSAGTCPECDSTDYMITGRTVTKDGTFEVARCFSCGYPVANSTRGMTAVNDDGPKGYARQIPAAGGITHNYHPEKIVDRAPGKRGPRTM